jgi:hypothetical protein
MDKRAYLRQQGFTVGDRGRFSAAMQEALAKAPKGAITEPVTVPAQGKTVKTPRAAKPVVVKVKSKADPKAVRTWAKANGVAVGDRGRIKPEVFAAYEAAQGEAEAPIVERKTAEVNFGNHAPLLVPSDAKWGFTDPKGKLWTVGIKTACADSGVSIGYCPEGEGHQHKVVVGDVSLGLVPVTRV